MATIEMKTYVCIWMEPTYNEDVNIESIETLCDENRGFNDFERKQIDELEVKTSLHFEDLIIVRTK